MERWYVEGAGRVGREGTAGFVTGMGRGGRVCRVKGETGMGLIAVGKRRNW